MRKINIVRPLFGCDPEFFFTSAAGQIVGAETVLPDGGLKYDDKATGDYSLNTTTYVKGGGVVVIDGVQAEMHPHPNTCRANIGFEIAECFRTIKQQLAAKGAGADFGRAVVEVDPDVLATLSDEAKKLGCMPSKNIHGLGSAELEAIDATTYRKRSAGGHLHMSGYPCLTSKVEDVVTMCDYLIGNTFVLLDRDPEMAERRRLYGRAGEYRTPLATKGAGADLEYRTLSNVWLRDYKLMSLAMGLARLAVSVVSDGMQAEFTSALDKAAVIEAINTNNFELARQNFNTLRPLIEAAVPYGSSGSSVPLWCGAFPAFDFFVDKGLEHWFPAAATVDRWAALRDGHGTGWETFLAGTVTTALDAEAAKPKPVVQPVVVVTDVPAPTVPTEPDVKRPTPARDAHGRFVPVVPTEQAAHA